jgi:hypothetical protein
MNTFNFFSLFSEKSLVVCADCYQASIVCAKRPMGRLATLPERWYSGIFPGSLSESGVYWGWRGE